VPERLSKREEFRRAMAAQLKQNNEKTFCGRIKAL
jgi:hypothetical protein